MEDLYILSDSSRPNLHTDDQNLPKEFAENGLKVIPTVWDDFDPPTGAKVLIRTPWDYPNKASKFRELLNKVDRAGAALVNSTETVRWNLDKRYLVELQKKGLAVVDTEVFEHFDSKRDLDGRASYPLVLKPLVGAGGKDTFLVDSPAEVSKARALERRAVLAQPYIPSIKTVGEYSYIFFDGEFSHAVLKKPKADEFRVQEEHGGQVESFQPSESLILKAQTLLKDVGRDLAYARVDLVEDEDRLLLMELEVIEPQLFFPFAPGSEKKFVEAVTKKFKV